MPTAMFSKFIKSHYLWIVVFTLVIIIRFMLLDKTPPGMQIDEVEYALSSKTFQMFGTDIAGTGFPTSLITTNTIGRISPVPYILLSPFWFFMDLTMANIRTLYVIINIFCGFVFIALLYELFKKRDIALLGGVLFLLNPWSFFLSRHAIDGAVALLFYLLGSLFLLQRYSKRNMLFSFLFFLLGCFSYHGAKIQLVPLVIIISVFKIYSEKLRGKKILPYILLTTMLSMVIAGFFVGGQLISGSVLDSRSHEFIFTNMQVFADDVNALRSTSIDSMLQNIMINKVIFSFQHIAGNYLQAFDVTFLFLKAEVLNLHGFFYFFEVIFLLAGIVALANSMRSTFYMILAITLIAPLSTIVSLSGFSVLNRGILLLPMLLIFITYGLYSCYEAISTYATKYLFITGMALVYTGSFIFFLYTYFFILPVHNFMHYETNVRVLAKYLSYEKRLSPRTVLVLSHPNTVYRGLLFFQPRASQENILHEKQTVNESHLEYTMENIDFINKCPSEINPEYTYIVDHDTTNCPIIDRAEHMLVNLKDAGSNYYIIGGKACKNAKLSRWRFPHYMSDFAIESMEEVEFCQRWISQNSL